MLKEGDILTSLMKDACRLCYIIGLRMSGSIKTVVATAGPGVSEKLTFTNTSAKILEEES